MTKVGFAGDGYPKLVFPSVVSTDSSTGQTLVGENVPTHQLPNDAIRNPFTHDSAWNFDDIKAIIHHLYNHLRIDPKNTPVLFSEPTMNHKENREQVLHFFFNELGIPRLLVSRQSELVLHAFWQRTGLVVELGHSASYCVPYFEGFIISPAIKKVGVTGKMILEAINNSIATKGHQIIDIYELPKYLSDIFYIANNFNLEVQFHERGLSIKDLTKNFKLTEGKEVPFAEERFKIPEILFQPKLYGLSVPSLTETIIQVLQACPVDVRKGVCRNLILSGGFAKMPGLDLRLKRELTEKLPPEYLIRINSHPRREWTTWIGADSLITKGLPEQFWHKSVESGMKSMEESPSEEDS